jgi:N-sulfoglucosamine sulfohydrolase
MLAGKVRRTDPDKVVVPPYLPDTPAVRSDLARLYDNVAYDDEGLGVLLAELEREGWLDNSILIVTGDHGDGLPRMKRSVHASGLHVPMMVRMPDGTGAGTRRDELVSFVDLAPTVLALAGLPVPEWMQGRVFVGDKAGPAPRYVLAGADRFDEMPQWQRSVIGARYQYVRNYRPDLAEFRPLAFRDVLPTMQELWRGHNAGSLPAEIAQWFAAPRPFEELYDLIEDPHTVRNLAGDPALASEMIAMREHLATFTLRHGDMSAEDERDMIARIWPGMAQPVTAAPVANRRGGMIELASATPGASIGWRLAGENHWRLYRAPFAEPDTPIESKALRYGYAESAISLIAPAGN